jgi:hypothetical protein
LEKRSSVKNKKMQTFETFENNRMTETMELLTDRKSQKVSIHHEQTKHNTTAISEARSPSLADFVKRARVLRTPIAISHPFLPTYPTSEQVGSNIQNGVQGSSNINSHNKVSSA